jgi:hypothetical protein
VSVKTGQFLLSLDTKFSFTAGRSELRAFQAGAKDLLPTLGLEHLDFRVGARGEVDRIAVSLNGPPVEGTRPK